MNLKVLIVDDEEEIRNSLIRNLTKWAKKNYITLATADSAATAMEFLEKENEKTALIISDHKMPHRTGSDFLKEVAVNYPGIMRIMLTGQAETSDISDLIAAGICAFLEKPWNETILISEISKALELYKLRLFSQKQERIQKEELDMAQDFQKLLLDVEIPESSNLTFHLHHRPSSQHNFGGDYYDILSLGNEKYLILLGDVSGHSLRASFLTAILKALIYSDFILKPKGSEVSPAKFLTWLNEKVFYLLKKTPDVFLGFSASIIDGRTGMVKLANGGQPVSLLVTPKGVIEACPPQIPLGIEHHYIYKEQSFQMEKADLLFLCTDGISPSGKKIRYIDKTIFNELLKEIRLGGGNPDLLVKAASVTETTLLEDDVTIISALMN